MLHTCRGIAGTSGAPILVGEGGNLQIAAIQIAIFRADGVANMVAIPAESIRRPGDAAVAPLVSDAVAVTRLEGPICFEPNEIRLTMADVHDKLGIDDYVVSSIARASEPQPSAPASADTTALFAEPFVYPLP
jgi:hypothetical protein